MMNTAENAILISDQLGLIGSREPGKRSRRHDAGDYIEESTGKTLHKREAAEKPPQLYEDL